jgi:hypothetical protein
MKATRTQYIGAAAEIWRRGADPLGGITATELYLSRSL